MFKLELEVSDRSSVPSRYGRRDFLRLGLLGLAALSSQPQSQYVSGSRQVYMPKQVLDLQLVIPIY